jgi:Protein of unknown function (DUF3995)
VDTIIAVLLFIVFLFLSGIHIYWACGGKWWTDAVFPTIKNSNFPKMPGVIPTVIVAIVLFCFGLFYLIKVDLVYIHLPYWLDRYGLWILASIFFIRAIGDFHYVGFFKKYKDSKFAHYDTKYYSPLCLVVGLLTMVLAFVL